ncbi:MAG: hypothetical protein ACI3YK_07330 [Eubacteriales bacterium]
MINDEKKTTESQRKGFSHGQRDLIIGLTVVFGVLLLAYLFIIRPLMKDDTVDTTSNVELIWSDEVAYSSSSLLLYPNVTRDQIKEIAVHNPKNDTNYVDWGFYYNETDNDELGLDADTFYLTNFEYAAFDETQLSYFVTAAGFVACSARVEDHCTDFSRYGLDCDLNDLSDKIYYTLILRNGSQQTVLIGDRTPSGTGYYVRSLNESTNLQTGETMIRDSVYVLSDIYFSNTILATPMAMVTPYLGYPANSAEALQAFAYWVNEEKYYYVPEGETELAWNAAFVAVPVSTDVTDPFSVFSGLAVYSTVTPKGYYSSSEMANLGEMFTDFEGDSVVELGIPMSDEEGEYIGFPMETLEKYYLDDENVQYQLLYKANGIENVIRFSKLQDDGTYYAYSLVFNVICKISASNVAFLEWDVDSFILAHTFFLAIDNCQSFSVSGSYFDLGVEQPYRDGLMNVDCVFRMEGSGSALVVTERATGKKVEVSNFRKLYTIMLQLDIRKEMEEDEIEAAMQQDPMATVTVVTRETYTYKTDDAGNKTDEIAGIRPSVTRIFRFYEVTGGRCLITIEDIDETGKSLGENGSFYGMTATVQKLLASTLDLMNDVYIDTSIRG